MTDPLHKPVAGVIGWPIAHSRSPLMHNLWLRAHGLGGLYVPVEVRPENLEACIKNMKTKGFSGFNATVPHKEAVFALVDEKDEAAAAIGAVNTVVFGPGGTLKGLNTDAKGFIASLAKAKSKWQQGPAIVLGAGGAARAVVYGLRQAGVQQIYVVNRTLERASVLAEDFSSANTSVTAHEWGDLPALMKNTGLLVNATSLGLAGGAPLTIDLGPLDRRALVTDIVYAPLETPLLKAAREAGHEVIDGLGMLIHQARYAFEAWFGILPDASSDIRAALENDLNKAAG